MTQENRERFENLCDRFGYATTRYKDGYMDHATDRAWDFFQAALSHEGAGEAVACISRHLLPDLAKMPTYVWPIGTNISDPVNLYAALAAQKGQTK